MAGVKKIGYKDWLLDIKDVLVVSGKCTNPFGRILRNVEHIMRQTLEIDAPKFLPRYIGWDQNDGSFKGKWSARKPGDRWTKTWYEVICWGQQDLKTKHGWYKIKITGWLETSYYYEHAIQKSLWWTYSFFFYNKIRRTMLDENRDLLYEIEDRLRVLFEQPTVENPRIKRYA